MKNKKARGVTLVEVMIAIAFTCAVCLGLYKVGWQARRYAEYARLATEARSLAKEKLEEIYSHSLLALRQPSCLYWTADTNTSSMGFEIVRKPSVVWHAEDKTVVGVVSCVYAEVHVDVSFVSPLWGRMMTNTFSIIIE